jgi:putative aldouronate transport system permease protein
MGLDFKRIARNKSLYLIFLPGCLYFIVFRYIPMFGLVVSFQDYNVFDGFLKSTWVGCKHFINFFNSYNAGSIIGNTITLNLLSLVFGFPAPIILAVLLNELRSVPFKKAVQTVSYLPHFVSVVVIAAIALDFLSPSSGLVSRGIAAVTGKPPIFFMAKAEYFRPIYILLSVWMGTGWGAIIYIAALAGVDPTLYEAGFMDGANRGQRLWHITLPSILPTIVIVFILRLGYILDVGFEFVYQLQNSLNYSVSEVISTYIYRRGIGGLGGNMDLSLATAVGMFQSAIGFVLIVFSNAVAKRINGTGLW